MAEPLFTDVFGVYATQDANYINIHKSDLPGLTANSDNSAESLIAGILLRIRDALSKTSFDENLDQSIYVEVGFPNFAFRGPENEQHRVDQLTVNFAKLDTVGVIDPDDY